MSNRVNSVVDMLHSSVGGLCWRSPYSTPEKWANELFIKRSSCNPQHLFATMQSEMEDSIQKRSSHQLLPWTAAVPCKRGSEAQRQCQGAVGSGQVQSPSSPGRRRPTVIQLIYNTLCWLGTNRKLMICARGQIA